MKTILINLYKFNELSKESQQKALSQFWDVNVNYNWWEDGIYSDAENVGIKITGFELDRGSYCNGEINDSEATAHSILKQHGENCDTYQTASNFITALDRFVKNWNKDSEGKFINEDDLDIECNRLIEEFDKSILEDYRIMLQKEYEYLTSKECVIETIEVNDYDFTEDGKLY